MAAYCLPASTITQLSATYVRCGIHRPKTNIGQQDRTAPEMSSDTRTLVLQLNDTDVGEATE